MNFLAHSYLSCSNEEILIGNLITDFLSKKEELEYEGDVLLGIKLHRHIDEFTDKHPASLELRQILRKHHGKYASVVVDLVWDRCLSINWNLYSGADLKNFTTEVYEVLERNLQTLNPQISKRFKAMIEGDFLMAYSNTERTKKSLLWMDNRAKYRSNFIHALIDFEDNRSTIQDLFTEFFPDVIKSTEIFCAC